MLENSYDSILGIENEQLPTSVDLQTTGNNIEQPNSQLSNRTTIKKQIITPKIWMNFDDFCACFTLIENNFQIFNYIVSFNSILVQLLSFIIHVLITIHENIQT